MADPWDGHERRKNERRKDWCDGQCPHLGEVKYNHRKEMTELKRDMREKASVLEVEKKASNSDLKGMVRLVSVLIILCSTIVAGQAIWLKSDISGMVASIQRLNIRITETVNDRIASDVQQLQKLGTIEGEIKTIGWRMTQLEDAARKEPKK